MDEDKTGAGDRYADGRFCYLCDFHYAAYGIWQIFKDFTSGIDLLLYPRLRGTKVILDKNFAPMQEEEEEQEQTEEGEETADGTEAAEDMENIKSDGDE